MKRAVRLIFLLVLLVIAGLVCWPVAPTGARGEAGEGAAFEKKVLLLERAMQLNRSGRVPFIEQEINAYLAAALERTPDPEKGGQVLRVTEINLSFNTESAIVLVLAKWGPVSLSYEVAGVPECDGESFGMDVAGARLGHLPMPGVLGRRIVGRVGAVFGGLERERKILGRVKELKLEKGQVIVSY